MLTRYNATSYFIHRGGQAGFDYELCERFARAEKLHLDVVIPEVSDDAVSLLNSGRADVICAGLTSSNHLTPYVAATRPVALVHKVLVRPPGTDATRPLTEFSGLTITVPAHDPYLEDLKIWRDQHGLDFTVQAGLPLVETEEMIARVARGELQATVADDAVVDAVRSYLDDEIVVGPVLGDQRDVVWLVRRNSPELLAALNTFLKKQFRVKAGGGQWRSQLYGIIYDRYFRNTRSIRTFQQQQTRPDKSGRLSPYDEVVREQIGPDGLDWRLVTALIYQESRFYPLARSKPGAMGLMQVMPHLAGPETGSLFVPAANIRAGLRLLEGAWNGFAYLDSLDRLRFSLAVYHAGIGHVTDARRLAMDHARDPNQWANGLAPMLPKLAQRRWFTGTRHGYYRGHETVSYVEEILDRYRTYMRLVPRDGAAIATSDTNVTAPADSAAFAAKPGDR